MKEIYENPVMDVIDFNGENILTVSTTDLQNVTNELNGENIQNVGTASWTDMMNYND